MRSFREVMDTWTLAKIKFWGTEIRGGGRYQGKLQRHLKRGRLRQMGKAAKRARHKFQNFERQVGVLLHGRQTRCQLLVYGGRNRLLQLIRHSSVLRQLRKIPNHT
jgi:hypothetical protein